MGIRIAIFLFCFVFPYCLAEAQTKAKSTPDITVSADSSESGRSPQISTTSNNADFANYVLNFCPVTLERPFKADSRVCSAIDCTCRQTCLNGDTYSFATSCSAFVTFPVVGFYQNTKYSMTLTTHQSISELDHCTDQNAGRVKDEDLATQFVCSLS